MYPLTGTQSDKFAVTILCKYEVGRQSSPEGKGTFELIDLFNERADGI